MWNTATLIGNLAVDPELREVGDGEKLAKLRVITDDVWFDAAGVKQKRPTTHFVDVWKRSMVRASATAWPRATPSW